MKVFKTKAKQRAVFLMSALIISTTALTGCFGSYRSDLVSSDMSSSHHNRVMEDLNEALAASDLRFRIPFVSDTDRPESRQGQRTNIVMHDFEQDRLPGSTTGFIKGKLEDVLKTDRPVQNNRNLRFVSFDLEEVDLKILEGNFISGRFGRYYARIDAQVRVTGFEGDVYLDEPISTEFEAQRKSFTGRQPDSDQDWYNIQKTLLKATEALGLEITQRLVDGNNEDALNLKRKPEYNPNKHISPEVFQPESM